MFILEARMLKTLVTFVRGRSFAIAEGVADQNALLILDQQMRDATGALDRAKKALAVAIAQESQEGQWLDATRARIEDLERRAVAAIEAGRDDLAVEAAEVIATLEAERDASLTARALFAAEIAKLKGHVLQQQMRFSQLERGRRIARAAEAALDALDAATGPIAVAEKLSAEGFGPRLKPDATDVMARLRQRVAAAKPVARA